ncbi:MAG: O-antigen ligase domain-containing protein [Candidatus Afipia apatlaquensis]|uniref:O-antigen ligase domain-containing protein n=1 Tax=Candidatus Afipia apatlaquensis TaxID=2712852 RepID=A0A7C9VE62_9BRAD|nr:O-antigen ligase domain-containing protein [Candidatus Afipia apatlaquensis]
MMRDALLALGLLLSTASQLRPNGVPIGPGEICLVIWITLMLGGMRNLLRSRVTPALARMLVFWTLFTISLCLGSATAFAISDVHDTDLFIHDILAYPLLAAVSFLSTVEPHAGCRIHRVAWLLTVFSVVFFSIQLASAWGLVVIPQIDPWYWDRLRGLSENPNQLAIFCAMMTFLAIHFAEHAEGFGKRAVAAFCSILSMYVGRLTKSDTFGVILVSGLLLFAALKLRSWLLTSKRNIPVRSAAAGLIVVMLPIIAATSVLFANLIEVEALDIAKEMAKGTRQETSETANIRLDSWSHAIDRGIDSGMLGLGPGPHIEIPSVLVAARREAPEPKYIEHPQVNGTPNFEAHNTFLDLFTQGGLIAVLSFTWLIATAFRSVYRSNLDALTLVVWSIMVLSIFHLIIRHPLFWFAIAFVLVAGTKARAPSFLLNRSK